MKILRFNSFATKVTAILILAMLISATVSDFLIYRYALKKQFEEKRRELMILAQLATLMVDKKELFSIPLNEEGALTPQYKGVAEKLSQIGKITPLISYVYVLKTTDAKGIFKFIIDLKLGSFRAGVKPALPGDEYDGRRFPEMMRALKSPSSDTSILVDEWGAFLSGYAPIKDPSGKTIAILGADISASDIYSIEKEVRRRAVTLLIFGIAVSFIIGILISGRINKPIMQLVEGTRHIADGDLDYKVKVDGSDEIAELASSFNRMSDDLKRHIEELKRTTAEKERFMKELEIARNIQQGFLPQESPKIPGVDIAAVSVPAEHVGGDFFDFIPVAKDKWGIVVADVSGKGIPAALFMALSKTLVRAYACEEPSVVDVVKQANAFIFKEAKDKVFVTLFYAVLDSVNMTLEYINAGHNPPMLFKKAPENMFFLKAQGVPLGLIDPNEMKAEKVGLKKNDILALYTDGVIEAINEYRDQFRLERLSAIIEKNRRLSAEEIIEKVREEVNIFAGSQPQFDDMTLMIAKILV